MKIEGARLVGKTWHYNKRVPKSLVESFDLASMFENYKDGFIRGTMNTKDPDQAKILAREVLSRLDKLEAKLASLPSRMTGFETLSERQRRDTLTEAKKNVVRLQQDQKRLIDGAGGVFEAGAQMRKHELSAAFIEASNGALSELSGEIGADLAREYVDGVPDHDFELADAQDAAAAHHHAKKAHALRTALAAADVVAPKQAEGLTISGLKDRYCEVKGYVHTDLKQDSYRRKYDYVVRRFVEYHGDVLVSDLTRSHLSEFANAFVRLPVSSRADVRPLPFAEAVKVADAEGLPRVSDKTRDNNLTLLKTLTSFAKQEGLLVGEDVWARYMPPGKREKKSAKRKVHTFSRAEVQRIVGHATAARIKFSIDYWAPLFACHQGLRLEEISQITIRDVVSKDGYLCLTVTDADDLQTVKTQKSFRTIPVHRDLIKIGFQDFVEQRQAQSANLLFQCASGRWDSSLVEVQPNSDGRFGAVYGRRFIQMIKGQLGINGYRAGFHSFRHFWADLARNAGMDYEIRRALSGRDDNKEGYTVNAVEDGYGEGFSMAVLAEQLDRLKPLDTTCF